ncbi:hypothetical protein [Microbacterium sp. YY-01]|uniref:hypothetical protein n=1 Tax=Microbacterium sp. YY-01 TaxID=3421634 RepID=UPI003D173585
MRGPYIGENLSSRSPFCFDPWEAYTAGIVKSHSLAITGVKGTGKSMLAKSFATRLCRMGRNVAVPHDPNGEWERVSEYVGGKTISIDLSGSFKINLLEAGERDTTMSGEAWRNHITQDRRGVISQIVQQLRRTHELPPYEHTAIDIALRSLDTQTIVTVVHVFQALRDLTPDGDEVDEDVVVAGRQLAHTLRRLVAGDLAGMFDGISTVMFDPTAPMMVVNTSALKNASPQMQALTRFATSRWVRNATTGSNVRPRVIVHEEAAIALMNDAYGGTGLKDRVTDEKVARHMGVSNWYLLHRLSDLDALGDHGSAMQTQARGLLADCETRVSFSQHPGEIPAMAQVLGWNQTMSAVVKNELKKGESLWQIGADRVALVKNKLSDGEFNVFRTDHGGSGA